MRKGKYRKEREKESANDLIWAKGVRGSNQAHCCISERSDFMCSRVSVVGDEHQSITMIKGHSTALFEWII